MSKMVHENNKLLSTRVGTPVYFAPEVIQHRMYSFPVDIWALGCVFYNLTTLEHPFKDATMETLGYYIVDRDPKPIKGPYSPQLITFILSLLEKNSLTRPTIHDLFKTLRTRKEQKIMNKVSIFNLKQILSMKAEELDKYSSPNKPKKSREEMSEGERSPTLMSKQSRKSQKLSYMAKNSS